jgi:ribonuclease P protein component
VSLKRHNRLRKRAMFLRAYKNGRVIHGRCFTLFVYKRDDSEDTRFGLTVTRKLGKAVARNRTKRRLRETAESLLSQVSPGLDVVINARHPALKADWPDLTGEMAASLRKARAIGDR